MNITDHKGKEASDVKVSRNISPAKTKKRIEVQAFIKYK